MGGQSLGRNGLTKAHLEVHDDDDDDDDDDDREYYYSWGFQS
jgi:hypothetical protein